MYDFVLIKKTWYLLITEYNTSVIEYSNKLVRKNLLEKKIYLDKLNYLLKLNIGIQKKWLSEGKILLVNRLGGITFLKKETNILAKIKSDNFPDEIICLNSGWLTPNGKLIPCKYGEHFLFASKYKGADKELFIPIGSGYIGIINVNKVTKEQKQWFSYNRKHLDYKQINILKNLEILE